MSIRNFENDYPRLATTVHIDPLALVIGNVTVGAYSSVWPMAVVRGDVQSITIGTRTNVQDHAMLHVSHDGPYCPGGRALVIGDEVTIGHHATLHACTIGHHCLIGIGAIILDGAVLEPYTLLAAGSLVSPHKVLEGGYLWRGSPAQKVRALTDQEMEHFSYSAHHYVQLAQRHAHSESLVFEKPEFLSQGD